MIFYEEVYDKINEDYINGEISYEMAEAANDLAYQNYITVEEAENAASAQPDQGKLKSLLSKFTSKLSGMASKCNVINNVLAKFKGKTDSVEQNIDELNANGGKCADGEIKNPKKSIGDFVNGKATSFKALPTAGKAAIGVGLAAGAIGVGVLTYKEYKKHEDAIKATIKKLQQELVKVASDTAKVIKEYLSFITWDSIAVGGALGSSIATSAALAYKTIKSDPTKTLYIDQKRQLDTFNKINNIGYGVGAGVTLATGVIAHKKMKQIEKESGVKPMIAKIIATVEAFAKKFGVAFDKTTTTMFAKFKKRK